jgi:hypothetical protein
MGILSCFGPCIILILPWFFLSRFFQPCNGVRGRSFAITRIDREFHRTGKYIIIETAEKIYIVIALSQRPINRRAFCVI